MQEDKSQVLITGANGFIGRYLCKRVIQQGWSVRCAVRQSAKPNDVIVGNLAADTDWTVALKDIKTVVHLAARVHVMSDASNDPLEAFRRINTAGTLKLAQQAAESGVKRFIYLSSIKVNGEATDSNSVFTEDDKFIPTNPYALSKYEAEQGLLTMAKQTQMDVVIIRPPLVYGPGAKANFLSMMKWLNKGIPLPFGAIHNKRSFIGIDNLVDFILTCIEHPAAANQVFLVSDGEDLSTTELLKRVARALGKKTKLLPIHQQLLEFILRSMGKKDIAERLCSSLQIDNSKAKNLLNWTPSVSVDEGLRKTAQHFLESK